MKTAGMLGGLGPESTIDYYRLLNRLYGERLGDGSTPQLIINSLDVHKGIAMLNACDHTALTAYLSAGIKRLAQAGADFAFIAANTPHIVFDEVARESPIPLLSIVEATVNEAKRLMLSRPAILGTRFTMQGGFYQRVFERERLTLIVPTAAEQDWMHEKYIGELLPGNFLPETREGFLRIIRRMENDDRIDGLVLAGTEIPLLLREAEQPNVPVLDTTMIHVEKIVEELVG
jgi:aspartate racemase